MPQFGGKNAKKSSSDSKRHFTVVMGGKEHGLYVSSTPSSAARKAVTKLCTANKSKKVEFYMREITQGSKKKTYGSYTGYIEKLKNPIELKGRVIRYKPVAKLSGKTSVKKGEMIGGEIKYEINREQKFMIEIVLNNDSDKEKLIIMNLVKPFNFFIDTETIELSNDDLFIKFKFKSFVKTEQIISIFLNNIQAIFESLKLDGYYKIFLSIPSKSAYNSTESMKRYLWFEKTPEGLSFDPNFLSDFKNI
jgi:hypothetical protein